MAERRKDSKGRVLKENKTQRPMEHIVIDGERQTEKDMLFMEERLRN